MSEGGFQSIPKLVFPGGALIGDAAGFLNVPKIKGTHAAMKSGMLAAEAAAEALAGDRPAELAATRRFRDELALRRTERARNIRPAFAKFGLYGGLAYSALDTFVLRGKAPWTLHHKQRTTRRSCRPTRCRAIDYPKPDGMLTFDRLSSVFISNTNHEEDQPVHLKLRDPARWLGGELGAYAQPGKPLLPGRRL